MNTLQQIFLVTYSILYGIMLNSCERFVLFPFGLLFKNVQEKVLTRIFFSFFIINLLPFVYFAWVYSLLGLINIGVDLASIVGTFFVSLFVFGFYRGFHVLILYRDGAFLYDQSDLPKRVRKMLDDSTWVGQVLGVLFYFLWLGFGFLLLSQVQLCLIIMFCSFMVGFLTIFVWLINCHQGGEAQESNEP